MKISVLCNRGPKAEEIPCAFHLGLRRLPILAVLHRWTDSSHRYFEVAVDDGRRFVLRHDVSLRCWELAGVFAAARPQAKPKPKPRPAASASPVQPKRWFAAWRG